MSDKAKYGIIGIIIVAAIFGLYAAFSKTEVVVDPTTQTHGGAGSTLASGFGGILCSIYPPACKTA